MKVLILCTGNSCRSQMAEGILQALKPQWHVRSAGTKPTNEVHPSAVIVMAEAGIDLASYKPKSVAGYLAEQWDLVWTVCGGAKETCPNFTGKVKEKIHIGFDDPAEFTGSAQDVLNGFRRVQVLINNTCKELAKKY
ncbi:MAG: arsenate reductase ArsC [SAR324 cluster bacterium]|nr:arsenate reductase ArsC [SAR324 cluster bacterium]